MKGSVSVLLFALVGVAYCQSPVLIDLYYESYCPYSRDFIANQLWPTYQLVPEIMSVRAYAYGNANETQDVDTGLWTFNCQHGPDECQGNLIDSCVLNYYPDQSQWIPFLGCAEGPENPNGAAPQCAIDNFMDWNLINTCANSDLGNQLEHQAAIDTESLVPTQDYTPWILINNVHDPTMETLAEYNLLHVVCDLYEGTPPANCAEAMKEPLRLNGRTIPKQTRESRR